MSDLKKSVLDCKKAIEENPNDATKYHNLGVTYTELGFYKDAIEAFKQAIHIDHSNANAHFYLGLSYLAIGDKSSILNEYKILKDLNINLAKKLIKKQNDFYKANKKLAVYFHSERTKDELGKLWVNEMIARKLCNFCSLKIIRQKAKRKGLIVSSFPHCGKLQMATSGTDIYVHSKDINLEKLSEKEREKYFVAWFMEIGDHCEC